jgi:dephospho-CoA kinase
VGSGKSTVAALLADKGAVIIDADRNAREVVEPGTPGYDAVVARFGPAVVADDGTLNRAAIAEIVFNDEQALSDLNAIVHPLVGQRMAQLMAEAPADAIVVHDVPLLVENNLAPAYDVVVVVLADDETGVRRLAGRGMPEADARARIAAQANDGERRAVADEIIENDGDRDALTAQVNALWNRLHARAEAERSGGSAS